MADTPSSRPTQYLIAPRSVPGVLQPMSADDLHDHITRMPDVKVLKRIRPKTVSTFSMGGGGGIMPDMTVAEMSAEQGLQLQASAPPNVIVERNARLTYVNSQDPYAFAKSAAQATLRPLSNVMTVLKFKIIGDGEKPLANASVAVYSGGFPAQAMTNDAGDATVQLFGGGADSVQAVYVKPFANHWERFIMRPQIDDRGPNVFKLVPFSQTMPGFPNAEMLGWGARLMRLDQFPDLNGRGIKIAIINSGCDKAHPLLRHVTNGADMTGGAADGWAQDTIAHGTHCAGVITGRRAASGPGLRGFAPEAEVHALKVFPGGRFDALIEALDECIARKIDIVNLSLGSDQPSELVARKIIEARQNGVACIVAAGNSSGPVQFPGNTRGVLTVAALGKQKEFPDDTNHAQTVLQADPSSGLFSAKFSCFGPEIAVSAPGVAILSSVPGGGYAAWDGTSMATPHVTGFAALLLAHHPGLEAARQQRNEQRVDQLFQVLRSSCVPMVADPQRGGVGLPMLDRVLSANIAGRPSQPSANPGAMAQAPVASAPVQHQGQAMAGNIFANQPGGGGQQLDQASLQQLIAAAQMGYPGAIQAVWQLRSAGYPI